ncbi:hypothetical protein [Bradyrhizobium cytisi]|uniref:Uncharacterized protein n=1 Tax=Bradyrhizobium cytisi TaxID=515489 RepID=A0A5S4X4Z8_9BRAD|nr:hypothetical protein [Bradyrhizobium cytisi]TYL87464.1 hypothetical protein FXB38_04930 [Bradyrhizobium cytisi]
MSDEQAWDATATADELVEALKPLFADQAPEVVGAVLGQLLAVMVAGHCPELRDEAMKLVIDMARDLVPVEVEQLIEQGRVGEEWRGTKQ